MKVNVKRIFQGCLFEDIKTGEVFYSVMDPQNYLMRTDSNEWVAVDVETGILYHCDDFSHYIAQYHIVEAEVTIS